jgi:hypothetical protein
MSWSGSTSTSKEASMARTADHQGDSPRAADGGQHPAPQDQRAPEPEAAVAVQLGAVLAASTVVFIAVEIEKWVRRRTAP